MSILQISNLTFGYEGSFDLVFENLSISLDTSWRLGLTGRNGRGKSTLLRLLTGTLPYTGTITCGMPPLYFPFPIPDRSLTGYELAEQLAPGVPDWQLFRELSLLRMDADTLYRPFETLSGGEQTKLLLAILFLHEDRFLLIDEPTDSLDQQARETVGAYLRTKQGFILVSHDRALLDDCVDHILAINRAGIELQQGNFSSWWENKRRQDAFEQAQNDRLQTEISRLTLAARQASNWSDQVELSKKGGKKECGLRPDRGYLGHKAAKMMQRSKSIEQRKLSAAEEKSKLLKSIEQTEPLKLSPLPYHSKRLIELEEVSVCYDGAPICAGVRLQIETGDRIALRGANGAGKTSLLRLLCGEPLDYTGTLRRGSGLVISCLPQHTVGLTGSLRIFAREHKLDESLFLAILRKLDFSRTQFEKDLNSYSSGQKKKVLLAKSLCEQAHLYIWDEPLNYVDVFSRMQIEELLRTYRPTILFVEHDRAFSSKIATKVAELTRPM